ncbi:MAG: M48 family metallopeptidase [Candidatus Aenigmatarchaeota archaeon]
MERISFYDQIAKNKRNSLFLAAIVFFFLVALIYVISLIIFPGLIFSFEMSILVIIFSVFLVFIYAYFSFNYGDKIVLSATNAKPIDENNPKYLHLVNTVEGLSIAAGIPKPKIYVIESEEINAFATGKNPENSSIAVTTGLLENLNRSEIEGVIGHEISHIRNYDIRFMTLVAVMVGLVAILSHSLLRSFLYGGGRRERRNGSAIFLLLGLILALVSPVIVRIVQFAISRRREFLADASSVELTRYPEGLASALEKIMKINQGKMNISEAVSHLFFTDPNRSPLDKLYATHPPIEERIKILRSM